MMSGQLFKRTGLLIRLNLKRDWTKILIWTVTLAVLLTAIAAKFDGIYSTQKAIDSIVTTLKTPAMVSLFGAFTAKAPYTTAKIFATEMVVFMAIIMVIMNIMLAVSTTRGEEDDGLLELVRAHAVGRLAPLSAGVAELTGLNLILGVLYGLGLQLSGMPGADEAGNWLIGFGLAAMGWLFGMLTLLVAQLADNASETTMLSYAIFGVMYIARMSTDVSDPRQTWWIPFGWIEKMSIYQKNDWRPLLLMFLFGLICAALAATLNWRRDLGAGFLATRQGRRTASPFLAGPATLLWRESRTVLLAWTVRRCLRVHFQYDWGLGQK